jgi:hypothetical protein
MPAGAKEPVIVHYTEHCPPDVGAAFIWLKNRDPEHWRDTQNVEHVLGKYNASADPYCASIRCTDVAVNGDPLLLTCPALANAAEICRSESGSPLRRLRASFWASVPTSGRSSE